MTFIDTVNIKAADSASIDAFDRLRVSNPTTIFDSKQLYDNAPSFWDDSQVSGSGTSSSHTVAEAATTMSVGATTAGKRVRQTFMSFNYQSGKSQLILLTCGEFDTSTGITKEFGQFNDDNGLFFRSEEGVVKVVRRTKVTGSAVDNEVVQSSWNVDKMDGTGVSGITLDFSKTQIGIIDYEWLGVGRVRMGWVVNGIIYYCHEFLNANSLETVYMSTPNLPLRYTIENNGTGAADDFVQICSSVMSEGGSQATGCLRYKSTEGTHVACTSENTIYAIVGLRLKSGYIGASIDIESISMLEHKVGQFYEWMLVFNPTVSGTFTYSDVTNSATQVATGSSSNTVTGGVSITGGHGATENATISTLAQIPNARRLGASINGTVDEIVLCARPVGGSSDMEIEGAIAWRELL